MFLFDSDLIIHESGVPPIHTSIAVLNELPVSTKKKMLIVHCKQIPEKGNVYFPFFNSQVTKVLQDGSTIEVPVTDLRIPHCGVEHTIEFQVPGFTNGYSKASKRFKLFSDVLFFKRVSPSTIFDLFSYCEQKDYSEGSVIIESGQRSDWFFLIESGQVNIFSGKGLIFSDY